METPQKRQKSWFSSLTGLVSASRSSRQDERPAAAPITKAGGSSLVNGDSTATASLHRQTTTRLNDATPARYSGTFSAPPVESPESPAKRASPSLMAQRKIHDRVQGPSSRLSNNNTYSNNASSLRSSRLSSVPRRTNFSSATTPRNIFRGSTSRELPSFEFTPRVPPNTIKGNFPLSTPGRSYRAPGVELSGRELAKTSASDLFAMKIPDPDPKLSGEVVAKMVPKDAKTSARSIYANEYLAHLCPSDFDEEQRNQFFCILDLRRLKYAADEVFLKKDWRLNILNFAKEYEKNRSLIMLRYGLYEFKTVKVSKDVFQKWKTANNIPDLDDEEAAEDQSPSQPSSASKPSSVSLSTPKPNGTEGILRTGKRKAQDNIDPASTTTAATKATSAFPASSSAAATNKRVRSTETTAREAEREPLAETATPVLNKSKRKASTDSSDQSKKRATPSQQSSSTPSATKAFLERIANSPAKTASSETPSFSVSKPPASPAPASQAPKSSSNGSLARSVLESGLKANTTQNNNIFGYLSDASSAKGSGNDNADADAEDTDESDGDDEEPPAKKTSSASSSSATPLFGGSATTPTPSLFAPKPAGDSTAPTATSPLAANGTTTSSGTSEASAPGRSLFDRVNKGSDGQPIRMFGSENAASSTPPPPPFGTQPTTEPASQGQVASLFSGNKTWNPDTPIKFSAGASTSPAKPLFGSTSTATPSLFGGSEKTPAADSAAPATEAKEPTASTPAADSSKQTESATPAATGSGALSSTPAPTFSFLNKAAGTPAASSTPSFFKPAVTEPSKPAEPTAAKDKEPVTAPAFPAPSTGASTPSLQSKTVFGAVQSQPATETSAAPATPSLFGASAKNDTASTDKPQPDKSLFGASFNSTQPSSAPTSIFSFAGASKPNGAAVETSKTPAESSTPAPAAKPIFSFGGGSTGTAETPKPTTNTLFGNPANTTPAAPAPIFGGLGGASATPATSAPSASLFTFGAPAGATDQSTPKATTAPVFGGGESASGGGFSFSVGDSSFNNPFASAGSSTPAATPSLSFGAGANGPSAGGGTSALQFGAGGGNTAAPSTGGISFTAGSGPQPLQQTSGNAGTGSVFGSQPSTSGGVFSFGGGGGGAAPNNATPTLFGQQKPASTGAPMFNLAPPMGGTSTGTNTPFTNLGGASSLATTPATGTPEPGAAQDSNNTAPSGHQADGDEAKQEQINLTEGGPGEEDEAVVHEIRAKAMRLATKEDGEGDSPAKDNKSPWKTEGVGPLRVLKHKTTGAIRLLLRAEPRGHVALNRALLPGFTYKPEPNSKYVKLTTANESGAGLETWMVQVKTKEAAQKLSDVLEENKSVNKK